MMKRLFLGTTARVIPFIMRASPSFSSFILKPFFVDERVKSLLSRKKLVRRAGAAILNGGPFLAQLNVTNACNQRCRMCNLWRDGKAMPFGEVIKTIDTVEKMGVVLLTITGGEPVLNESLGEIIGYAAGKEFLLNINTNGTMPHRYKGLPVHLLDIATISFHSLHNDTLKKITNSDSSVASVTETIKYFKGSSDAHIILKFVICRENIGEIEEILAFANKMDVSVEYDPVMVGACERPVASAEIELNPEPEKFIEVLQKIKNEKSRRGKFLIPLGYYDFCVMSLKLGNYRWDCDAGLAYFSIYPDGRFGICKDVYTDKKITDDDFIDVWKGRAFRQKMDELKNSCDGCNWSCYHTASSILNNLNIIESL